MVKKHSRKATARPSVDIERLAHKLANLPDAPAPPQRTDTQRYLIEQLRDPLLRAATQYGYSVQRLADLLREEGITIHPSTLRRYLGPLGHRPVRQRRSTPLNEPHAAVSESRSPDAFQGSAAAPKPENPPTPSSPPAIHLSSRFTPKLEVPYDELIRQGEARQKQRGEPASKPALPPSDKNAHHE